MVTVRFPIYYSFCEVSYIIWPKTKLPILERENNYAIVTTPYDHTIKLKLEPVDDILWFTIS